MQDGLRAARWAWQDVGGREGHASTRLPFDACKFAALLPRTSGTPGLRCRSWPTCTTTTCMASWGTAPPAAAPQCVRGACPTASPSPTSCCISRSGWAWVPTCAPAVPSSWEAGRACQKAGHRVVGRRTGRCRSRTLGSPPRRSTRAWCGSSGWQRWRTTWRPSCCGHSRRSCPSPCKCQTR